MHENFSAELKATREQTGLSVQDIFERTRINIDFLEAIESGDFDVLPEVYIRLFLRKYAQEIGLDPDDIMRRYERAGGTLPPASTTPSPLEPSPQEAGSDAKDVAPSDEAETDEMAHDTSDRPPVASSMPKMRPRAEPGGSSRMIIITGAAVGVLIIAAIAFVTSAPDAPPGGTSSAIGSRAAQTPGSAASGAAERVRSYRIPIPNAKANSDSISLEASALSRASVTLTIDGRPDDEEPDFQQTVAAGDHFVWKAKTRFLLEIDRAEALEFVLQGRRLPISARSGSRLKLFISPASVWVEEIQSPAGSDDSF